MPDERSHHAAGTIQGADWFADGGVQRQAPLLGLMDPRELWATVRRRPWTVAIATVLVTALVYLLIGRGPPQYSAGAVIRIFDSRRAIAGGFVEPSLRVEGLTDPILTQQQILRSRAIAMRMLDDPEGGFLRLRAEGVPLETLDGVALDPWLSSGRFHVHFDSAGVVVSGPSGEARAPYGTEVGLGGLHFTVPRPPGVADAELVVLDRERTLRNLVRKTSVKRREGTDIVDVFFSSPDPHVAQRTVNLLVRTFMENDLETGRQRARRRRLFLEEQLAQNDRLAESARDSLTRFRSTQRSLTTSERFSREQAALTASSELRDQLAAERMSYEMLLRQVQTTGGPGSTASVRVALASARNLSPIVSQLGEQLVRLEGTRDSLRTGPRALAATNPDIIALEERIGQARVAFVAGVQSQLETVRAREQQASLAVARGSGTLGEIPGLDAEELRLVERHESYQRISNQLREEYQRAKVAEAVVAGDVEIIDEAGVPTEPTGLPGWRAILFGLCLGLFFGTGAAYGREVLNTSFRRREEVEATLGIPGLAIIPSVGTHGSRRRSLPAMRSRGRRGEQADSRLVRRDADPAAWFPEEAFRVLRTNLLFGRAPEGLRMLVVTSARASEGKTTIAANLSVCFARQGMRVLLVDCDLRRPRLHDTFGVPREPGFTCVMSGQSAADQAVRATSFDNLFLLPAGRYMENQAELLGGAGMRQVFRALGRDYDMLIVDTPPVLITADAAIVAAVSDAVLLVVHAGRTTYDEARRALQQLRRVDANVLGAVLNDREERTIGADAYYDDIAAYTRSVGIQN